MSTVTAAAGIRAPRRIRAGRIGAYALLVVGSLLVAFPLLITISYSFMAESDIITFPPPVLPKNPTLHNYEQVLQAIPIGRYLLNSFVVSTVVVIGQLITASLAAFAFSFVQFRGRTVLFFVFLSTLMIGRRRNRREVKRRGMFCFCSP